MPCYKALRIECLRPEVTFAFSAFACGLRPHTFIDPNAIDRRYFVTRALQHARQPLAGVGVEIRGNLFRRAFGDDVAAAFAAFGTEIDHPVGALDHVEIVLDDDQRAAAVNQLAKCGEQL